MDKIKEITSNLNVALSALADANERLHAGAKIVRASSIFLQGETLFHTCNFVEAEKKFKEVVNLDPGHQEARKRVAEVHNILASIWATFQILAQNGLLCKDKDGNIFIMRVNFFLGRKP